MLNEHGLKVQQWYIIVMLFRSSIGTYVEINREDYLDDKSYYEAIIETRTPMPASERKDPLGNIIGLCQKKERKTYNASRRRRSENR